MTLQKLLKLWVPQVPPKRGATGAPNFFIFYSFTAAAGGGKWAPQASRIRTLEYIRTNQVPSLTKQYRSNYLLELKLNKQI